jgi:predicted DsbA family dithiol-disulfide isomerase
MKHLQIDIFSDVVCPWCFIGTKRLSQVISAWDEPLDAKIVHHSFFLDPTTPPGGIDLQDMLRRKYGVEPRTMFGRVEHAAHEAGILLDLEKQRFMYPTVRAHTLIRHAAAKGTQLAMVDALFAAYFLDARNVDDESVLAEIASTHGFGVDEALALVRDEAELKATLGEARDAAELGIRGVPFFIFNGELAVSGAQRPEVFRQVMHQALGTG